MKKEEMDKIVKFELGYIPSSTKGSVQNQLRFYYSAYRRKGLVNGKQREEALKEAIERLKEKHPDFNPVFDENFFKMAEKSFFGKLADRLTG
ncbi:MAG: hypothetical protein ACLFU9_04470 [Candidatus Bathyarchaeia archaeon]